MLIDVYLLDANFATGSNGTAKRIPPLSAKIDPSKVKAIVPFDYLRSLPPQLGGIAFQPLLIGLMVLMDENNMLFIEEKQPPGVMEALESGGRKEALQI